MKHDGLNFRKTSAYSIDGFDKNGHTKFTKSKSGELVDMEYTKTNMGSINQTGQFLLILEDVVYIAPRPKMDIDENTMSYFMTKETRRLSQELNVYVKPLGFDFLTKKFQLRFQSEYDSQNGFTCFYSVTSYGEVELLRKEPIILSNSDFREFQDSNALNLA